MTNKTEENVNFVIQKIYTKDSSFEAPNSPDIFREDWKPDANVDLNVDKNDLGDDIYEVILTITVTTKSNKKTAFLVEAKQAGIFTVSGMSQEQLMPVLGSYCPNVLFPYARETISSLVSHGGFPELSLAPVNFDALFAESQQQKVKVEETTANG